MSHRLSDDEIREMNSAELADELERWAVARENLAENRRNRGKPPLDTTLLREAATRLRLWSQSA